METEYKRETPSELEHSNHAKIDTNIGKKPRHYSLQIEKFTFKQHKNKQNKL